MQHKRSRALASPRSPFLFALLALAVGGTAIRRAFFHS
ncbi:hypothetical protein, partial [Pseudomonas aeruginosa]